MVVDLHNATQDAGEQLHRFPGGLRLRHNKKISCQKAVEPCPLPKLLTVPLLQHRGEAAASLVEVGDKVLGGQPIGRVSGSGAAVHAPTSGVVESLDVGPMSHPSGFDGPRVVIRPDGEDRFMDAPRHEDWRDMEPARLRQAIRAGGIVGLGGAVYPTGPKTDSAAGAGIHTLIINGAECEPYISCDEMLMRERPNRIVLGAMMLQHAVGARQTVIAIEDQMGAVGEALSRAVKNHDAHAIKVVHIPKIYPEGGEKQLIQVLTGVEVPDGGLPQDLGLLCQNVGTAAAVADCIQMGRPLLERYVTVTGNGIKSPCNLLVRIGTPVADLVAAAGGYTDDAERLLIGGPMMGYALDSDAEPVVKATNCVLVMNTDDIRPPQPVMPCIRCGECARVCPALLMPQELHFRLNAERLEDAADWGLQACIECGCCDFVCPSQIPLADWFRWGKGALRQARREKAESEHARERFEAREARLAQANAEKAERLARRKQALKDDAERKRKVAEAIARANAGNESADGDSES